MKWEHKKTGWIAETNDYCNVQHMTSEYIDELRVKITRSNNETIATLPIDFVLMNDEWQPIPDDRWLEFRFTMREFIELLGIIENSETFLALKEMADKLLADHINKIYK